MSSLSSPTRSTHFPYTTLFRSDGTNTYTIAGSRVTRETPDGGKDGGADLSQSVHARPFMWTGGDETREPRSEEHTSELQSRLHLVCRLLLEKKKLPYRTVRQHR